MKKQRKKNEEVNNSLFDQYQAMMGNFPIKGKEGVMFKKFSLYDDSKYEIHTCNKLTNI